MKLSILGATIAMTLGSVVWSAGTSADDPRYTMTPTEDGFVRLNNETGKVSICREKAGGFVCEMAADERAAYEAEILALTERVERLDGKSPAERAGIPTEEELDEAFGLFEGMAKRLARAARVFGSEMEKMDEELSNDPFADKPSEEGL